MNSKELKDSALNEDLRDPQFAAGVLKDVLHEADLKTFLSALRGIVEANGGPGELAKLTGLERENLDKTLSENGDPRLAAIQAILNALGLRLSVVAVDGDKEAA